MTRAASTLSEWILNYASIGDWDRVLDYVAIYGDFVASRVFHEFGPEAARGCILGCLFDLGFMPRNRNVQNLLLAALQSGSVGGLVVLLQAEFFPPPTRP